MRKHFSAVVIGGGPGGYVAALRLANLGIDTLLIERDQLGGTCLNRGCIPTKTLMHGAEVYQTVRHAEQFGVSARDATFDYSAISRRKDSVVSRLRKGIERLEEKAGVEVAQAAAAFFDCHTLRVGDEIITADHIVIATGSRPAMLGIPGVEIPGVVDSDAVLKWNDCPKSIAIIGGGVIGVEFASLFSALGVHVHILEMAHEILPTVDEEIAAQMRNKLLSEGVEIFTNAKVLRIEEGVTVVFDQQGEKRVVVEKCIIAVGRNPVTDGLGLECAGVRMNGKFIDVDAGMRTNQPGIYAIGDVTGKAQLAHVAMAQAMMVAENIAGSDKVMDYNIVPSCVYSSPEIASVGLTEKEAAARHRIKIGRFDVSANGRSTILNESTGLIKIITEERTGEILGCHILAPRATDMIGEICVAMRSEGTIEELADTIHPHPTISEMIMEAAHDAMGACVHRSKGKTT